MSSSFNHLDSRNIRIKESLLCRGNYLQVKTADQYCEITASSEVDLNQIGSVNDLYKILNAGWFSKAEMVESQNPLFEGELVDPRAKVLVASLKDDKWIPLDSVFHRDYFWSLFGDRELKDHETLEDLFIKEIDAVR